MDFHSLLRRDLQFLCKRNKIPANMTNLAMADALKSLEIVEGLDEYMNQNDSNVVQSPTSVAKLPPSTATRTTRRKATAVKAEPELVSRPCGLASKSLLHGENVAQESKANNVKFEAKTPAARKASAAASCSSSKVQGSKKGELVQSAYSTRRSTRLLEKCMADLSLVTKETEQNVSAKEKTPAGSEEAEVIPGRDLSASMEKEWGVLETDSDQVTGGLEISVEKTETMEVMSDEKDKEEETMQANEAVCEEDSNKNDNDQDLENCVNLDEIPVLEHANTETNNEDKESKNIQAFESLEQDDHLEIEQAAIQENDSEPEKVNTLDEETVVDQADGDSETEPEEDDSCVDSDSSISEADSNQADHQETEQVLQENDSEPVKINTFDEATMVDQTEPEEEGDSGVDSDGNISEADSNQAVQGSDIAEEEMMILSESEGSVTAPTSPSPLLEEAKVKTAPPISPFAAESISAQFPRPNKSAATTPSKNSAMKLVSVDNNNKENDMEMMANVVNNGESKGEEAKKKKKVEFDEENLKDASMRKLVKMVKELSIKGSNNRTALQMLPGNNQTAE